MIKDLYKKIGKFFIYKKNVLILLTSISLLTFYLCFFITKKFIKINRYQNKFNHLEYVAIDTLEKRKQVKDFIEKHITYDKFFIDNNLENMKFLQKEKEIFYNLLNHPAFCNNSQIRKRLNFIQGDQNSLKFAEENVRQTALIKETDENQLNIIEIDENDLQRILSIIEPSQSVNSVNPIDSPQLIIKNFVLNKEKENSFLLEMKILKREYLKK